MILFIIYVILSTSGLILFKLGAPHLTLGVTKSLFSAQIPFLSLLGLACYFFSFALWMYIISKTNLSFIVPLGVAVTNIAILACSYFFLNEKIGITGMIGAALIIIGVIIMNIK